MSFVSRQAETTVQLRFGESTWPVWHPPRTSSLSFANLITVLSSYHSARATTEVEPQLTLRGHSAAITRLIHAPLKGLLYSASLDSSIRVWALPLQSHTTYAPYDETRARGELIGHTDAVWDLALVRDESTLISCGAEGTVKVWDVSGPSGGGSLRLTWGWAGLENADDLHEDYDVPGATAVEALKADLKKVAVAYQNAVVKVFDIESGKELSRLQSDMSYGAWLVMFFFKDSAEHLFRWYTRNADKLHRFTPDHVAPCNRTRGQVHPDI